MSWVIHNRGLQTRISSSFFSLNPPGTTGPPSGWAGPVPWSIPYTWTHLGIPARIASWFQVIHLLKEVLSPLELSTDLHPIPFPKCQRDR